MVVLLAVAALTRSHVIAIEWVDLMAEDNSCCSMMAVDESASGSVVRVQARVEVIDLGGGEMVVEVATSSGMGMALGLAAPHGWRESASAALCLMPGMWTMRKR